MEELISFQTHLNNYYVNIFQSEKSLNQILFFLKDLEIKLLEVNKKSLLQNNARYLSEDFKPQKEVFKITVKNSDLKSRLDLYGYSNDNLEENFNLNKKKKIDSLNKLNFLHKKNKAYPVFGATETKQEEKEFLENFTFEEYKKSVKTIINNQYRKQIICSNLGNVREDIWTDRYGFPSHINNVAQRYIIENFFHGFFDDDLVNFTSILESLDGESDIDFIFPLEDFDNKEEKYKRIEDTINHNSQYRPIKLITEGFSDSIYLTEALQQNNDTLIPYFNFHDFNGKDGGWQKVVSLLKAYNEINAHEIIIGIFDNDKAGIDGLMEVNKIRSTNIGAIKLPDLDNLKEFCVYNTITEDYGQSNVNSKSACIELYLDKHYFRDEIKLSLNRKTQLPQLDKSSKKAIAIKFDGCDKNELDWSDLNKVWDEIIEKSKALLLL
ncbi:HEPN/Toprim-associated domain-containing protein [Marivirga salinae]|uniref:HEPN/Toprim-associated domain-containing protein n=1 Tax=Marivirga salinarum TaxID=3059078 RepID=A0AA51REN6_9BACT|nr:HEPN/Toprim-associated domain-containing protein [Marivirga sp. BDSF4-3]WMN12809.1 HEPN/Toprim-associated domain-containing protein [Marivirga sp. BDSF4-3]